MSIKITIVNVHWSNRGDEAALKGLWTNLRNKFPKAQITTVFKDKGEIFQDLSKYTDRYYSNTFRESLFIIFLVIIFKGKIFKNKNISKFIGILNDSDIIIYGPGGSVISDKFFNYKQLEYLTPIIFSYFYKIPFFVMGPSFGPFEYTKKFFIRNFFLKKVQKFCVRENISEKYLVKLLGKINIETFTDFAFYKDQKNKKKNFHFKNSENSFFSKKNKIIGITYSDFKWHVVLGKDKILIKRTEQIFKKFIKYLILNKYKVLLIPQLFCNQNDYDLLKKLSMINPREVRVLSAKYDSDEQKQIINKLYAVVGCRYHSIIFAFQMMVPFISIIYEEKTKGFLEMNKLDSWGIDLNNLSFNKLLLLFKKLEKSREKLKKTYIKLLPRIETKSKSYFKNIFYLKS